MSLRSNGLRLLAAAAALAVTGNTKAPAQYIIDHRAHVPIARSYEVSEVSLDARIRDQVAEVQLSQTFHNPGSFPLEAEFLFPLPDDGAVQNFVLLVDGRELPGRLLPKDEARRIYEDIVRTKRDPALLEYMGRGLYRTSVFPIPAGADRKVTMRYTQVCRRDRDIVEFTYPFASQKFTAKPIRRLSLTVRVESRDAIKSVYCPSHDADVRRDGDHEARVSLSRYDTTPSTDFRLVYTLADGALGASVLSTRPTSSEDGYFLLLASPQVRAADVKPAPKTVVFVLDRSGSMAGKKIEQARNALKFVLANLRDDDTFNIVVYDDRVETFRPELQRYSPRTREEAERFVENVREGGSTNIDDALKTALGMIPDSSRPGYVLFLTDGLPTAGETRETAIADHCRSANRSKARVFAFGVGYDVNARLLDRLSGGNSGASEYVKPDEDIESHVSRFYSRFTSPVLADVRVGFSGVDVNRTYPRDLPDLFDGGQLLVAGRYSRSGPTTLRVTGKVAGERRSYEFPVELASSDRTASYGFVETVWATRRVGDLIDQIDLHGRNSELVDELVSLSKKYGILTPYTSFLADERVQLHARVDNLRRANESLNELSVVTGASGVDQRAYKQNLKDAQNVAASEPGLYRMETRVAGAPAAGNQPGENSKAGYGGFGAQTGQAQGPVVAGRVAGGYTKARGAQAGQPNSPADNVRRVGGKTFYRKGRLWVDSTVTPEQEASAVVVRQFSDDYFKLARAQEAEQNQYLAFDEAVVVNIDGKTYRVETESK
jgi:Ca-activated chloride channel family protein